MHAVHAHGEGAGGAGEGEGEIAETSPVTEVYELDEPVTLEDEEVTYTYEITTI